MKNKTVKVRKSLRKNKAAIKVVKVDHNHVKARHYLETLVSMAEDMAAGAVIAIVVHWYFGELDSTIDVTLYFAAASLYVVSVWMRSILAGKKSD